MIETYGHYTPEELRDRLLNTPDGDASQLHSALIVLCGIVASQQSKIEALAQYVTQIHKGE